MSAEGRYPFKLGGVTSVFRIRPGDLDTADEDALADWWFEPADFIALDAASNGGYETASSTDSWSHTCTGSDRYLVVGVSMLSVAQTVSGITYNGVAMTQLGAQSSMTGAARVELWGLIAPATGSNTITVTLTGAIAWAGNASSYTGVHQTSPTEGWNSAGATNVGAADATVNITTVADNDWVVDILATDDAAVTVGAGQTQTGNVTGAGGSGAMSYEGPKTPGGSVTMSWANVGALATWVTGGVALRPVAASGGSTYVTQTASLSAAIQAAQALTTGVGLAMQTGVTLPASVAAVLQEQKAAVAALEAAVQAAKAVTSLANVAIQAFVSSTASAGAAVQAALAGTASGDVVVQAAQTQAAAAAAAVQAGQAQVTALEAAVQATQTNSTSTNLNVLAGTELQASADAAVQAGLQQASTADLAVVSAMQTTASAQIALQALQQQVANVSLQIQASPDLSLALQATVQFSQNATAAVQIALQATYTASSNLAAAVALSQSSQSFATLAIFANNLAQAGLSVYVLDTATSARGLRVWYVVPQRRTFAVPAEAP